MRDFAVLHLFRLGQGRFPTAGHGFRGNFRRRRVFRPLPDDGDGRDAVARLHPRGGGGQRQQFGRLGFVRCEHDVAGEFRVAPLQHGDAAGGGGVRSGRRGSGRLLRLEHDDAGLVGRFRSRLAECGGREGEQREEEQGQAVHETPSAADRWGYRTERPPGWAVSGGHESEPAGTPRATRPDAAVAPAPAPGTAGTTGKRREIVLRWR